MNTAPILFPGFLLLFVCPPSLRAQTPAAPPPPHEAKVELAVVATNGNSETQSIGVAGEFTIRLDSWVVTLNSGFVRNEAEGVVNAKSLRTMERVARTLRPGLDVFGQHAYLRDTFSGVTHRNSLDAGLSYRVLQEARHELVADAGFGYLSEQRTAGPDLSTGLATAGTRYRLRISDTSEFTDELLFAADVIDVGTWRINQAAAVTARVTMLIALKVSNVMRFVNEPVPGFERVDSVTSASLVVSF